MGGFWIVMGYKGETYIINCSAGGLNGSKNLEMIPPESMVVGTRNLNLNKNGREKRGGTTKYGGQCADGAVGVMGLFDYHRSSGTAGIGPTTGYNQYIMFGTSNGKIWISVSSAVCTSWTSGNLISFETFEDEVYICNGKDYPVIWTGTTNRVGQLADTPSDWSDGTSSPKYMIRHGRGASERMIAFGCPANPYTLYISPNGDGDDFGDANVILIYVDTGDGQGIVGATVFMDSLLLFGKSRSFVLDDADTDTANWGYWEATWQGGAAHHKLIMNTANDVIIMTEDGEIYSVVAAEQTKDYKRASISRPAFIHEWIKENLDLTKIDQFHGVYDPVLRAVRIFVIRKGQTTIDTALLYFIDRGPENGWMIHDNLNHTSGYSALSSALIQFTTGDLQIWTGDYSGNVWQLEQSTASDNNEHFDSGFKTPPLPIGNPRANKNFPRGWVTVEDTSDNVAIDWWLDNTTFVGASVTPTTGLAKDYEFPIGQNGNRIQLEVFNNTSGEKMFVDQVMVDFKMLGKQAGDIK